MFVLPVLTLLAAEVAQTTRMIRATMIDVLDSNYVMMARLKGVRKHACCSITLFRMRLPQPCRSSPLTSPWLTGGVVVVESVFNFLASALAWRMRWQARSAHCRGYCNAYHRAVCRRQLAADIGVILLNPRLRRQT